VLNVQSNLRFFNLNQLLPFSVYPLHSNSRQFHTKTLTNKRVGPHNIDIISVLVGCLLGDAYSSKSKNLTGGSSFRFKQSGRHKDYLFFLYDLFFLRGYCTDSGPRLYKTILVNSANVKKIYFGYEFDLFTFSSLNWMYDLFYLNGKKIISPEISKFLTPMALAFLIMDDGGWVSGSKSVRIATNNFTLQEVELLRDIFKIKFDLDCTIQLLSKGGGNRPKDKYSLYFKVASLPKLRELVLPFMIPSMKYKLGL